MPTTKQQHTPEPWKADGYRIERTNGQTIGATIIDSWQTHSEMMANARRIVACVNACAGIDTEQLEPRMLGDQIAAKMALIDQRDELAAALREFVSDCDAAHGKAVAMALSKDWPDLLITYTKAKNALAKLA